jgi:eukaryotic-like serine/threonine-protein kinase
VTSNADDVIASAPAAATTGIAGAPTAITLASPVEEEVHDTTKDPAGMPPVSIESTAIMPAVGAACPVCKKPNHPGVSGCVFCGAAIDSAALAPAKSGFGDRSMSTSDAPPSSRRADFFSADSEIPGLPVGDPLIGVVVAERYKIVEALGRGGMGAVYKVEHTRIGKLLAMKLLTGELSRNPDVVRRFKLEALTVSKLSSPNTVQVFDFGASEGLTYLVMELVNGDDLGRTLRAQGPMPWSRVGRIIIQVCSSLAEAHQKGIVHRDIKPENVMLVRARDGTDIAKVLDFGLAKLREGEGLNDVTSQGAIVGTPYFMAPEQIKGESVDARTDIYALGAMMYRALTGHYPFNGTTPMAVFTKHLTEAPVAPVNRAPELDIPMGINRLVLKALSKSAEARFQKVEDLQARLIEELKSVGASSVDNLLDSGQLRRLAKATAVAAAGPAAPGAVAPKAEIATRDEVFAYERKLRRQRYGAIISLGATLVVGAAAGAKLLQLHLAHARDFKGVEVEPNDSAKEATPVPLGSLVTAQLGQRLDPTHGDRDFFAVEIPASPTGTGGSALIKLEVSALPNLAMCTLIYKQGLATALGQYCVGRPGRALTIPALRLEPGRYLITELQDLDPYGGPLPFIHENVSDSYTLLASEVEPAPGLEIEPNDQVASAEQITPGGSITASIGWAHDEDVFCVPERSPGKIRWKVRDGLRDTGILQVIPIRGVDEGAPVRIHRGSSGKTSVSDVLNPWISPAVAKESEMRRCLRVGLEKDPWAGDRAGVVPSGGSETYTVEVEAVP